MRLRSLIDGLRHRVVLRHWRRRLARLETLDPSEMAVLERRARQLQRLTGQVMAKALAKALPATLDANSGPDHHNWAFRPDLWLGPIFPASFVQPPSPTRLCAGATLYHDAPDATLNCSQVRARDPQSVAPLAFAIETHAFTGSFASLALELPDKAWKDLSKSELIGLALRLDVTGPCKVFGRANVRHGPNTEKLVREINLAAGEDSVEFDLLYANIEMDKISGMWLDLIFESPANCQIVISDCIIVRHPRANV